MTYTASITGHDISRARTIEGKTLAGIKRAATREFGDGFQHHIIVIQDRDGHEVSRRPLSERRWRDVA